MLALAASLATFAARPAGPAIRDTLTVNRAPGSVPVRTIGGAAVIVLPAAGLVRFQAVEAGDSLTRLVFLADRPDDAALASRTRAHFRLRFDGFFAGALPESLPSASLVRSLRPIGSASGSAFE